MADVELVRTVAALRAAVARQRAHGRSIGLVPTMGALHEGHIALVEQACREADCVIATIFVNPTQFAANEDLSKYPRTEEADLERLAAASADIVFAPAPEEIYPAGFSTRIVPAGPAAAGLEDRFRPEHFGGVATVVAKLFLQSGADIAVFGEKDYQQLAVVRRMAADLDIPIRVLGLATVRAPDGLALSSRNRYLSPAERQTAPILHRALAGAAKRIAAGEAIEAALAQAQAEVTQAGFRLDYLEARDAESLAPVERLAGRALRLLVAARLGQTRLIDNVPVPAH